MADFFDSDVITKGYDARITRRIVGYLKPYRLLAAIALLALAVGTAGELYLPVLVRRTVDDALMVSWFAVDEAAVRNGAGKALRAGPADPVLAGKVYLKAARLGALGAAERKALEASGALDPEPRYLLEYDRNDIAQTRALAAAGSSLVVDGKLASMTTRDLRRLAPADAKALRRRDSRTVSVNVLILFAVLAAVLAATFFQIFLASLIGQRIMKDLRMELFRHASTRSLSFLSRQPVGRLVTRMTSDVETINQFFTDVVAAFLKDGTLMVGVLAVLFVLDARLALVALASLPPVAIATAISRRKARDAFRRQRTWLSKVNSYIAERLSGIAVVKLFAREAASRADFEERDRELMRA
ncbi:MAG: ABC transporter ATP-binding protein, partial [Spirochaetaceae bacterium]|nr:ABC transporter ATP-binding protein [Spirochaetaceae bacterium]